VRRSGEHSKNKENGDLNKNTGKAYLSEISGSEPNETHKFLFFIFLSHPGPSYSQSSTS
jgi:hypothetical protein